MQVRWLGTPRRLGDPVPACPAGMVWSSSEVKCVPGPAAPTPPVSPLPGGALKPAQVCPEGWKWGATYGECLPPQDVAWPEAKCPPGYKFDNKVLYCVPVSAPLSGTEESRTPAALIAAGLVLVVALVAAS